MSSNPPPSRGFGGSLERFARRAKGVFGPRTPSQLTTAHERLQQAGHAWSELKVTLKLLEGTLHTFPLLKSAVAEFLGVVDIFEEAAQTREDCAELALNLQEMVKEFMEYPGEHTSCKMSDALQAMMSRIQKETEHTHIEMGKEVDDVQGCYRRVEALCHELRIWGIAKEQQLDPRLLKLNPASTAAYDSDISTSIGRRKCTPGTRRLFLEGMRIWANDSKGPNVYWLTGMAGTGKTALAYSFCAELKAAGRLGASFFCSRADLDSRKVSRMVHTIALQLAHPLPAYREQLIRRIDKDEDIGAWDTTRQFLEFIYYPLNQVSASIPAGVVVTIDALDECDDPQGARDILDAIFDYASYMPIKFFVTSRPEPGLYDALPWWKEYELHDLGKAFVPAAQADIRSYLKHELSSISLCQEKLERLAEQAGTQFIYAATAVRYIDPNDQQVNSLQRLDVLLSIPSNTKTTKHCELDDLYTAVLAALLPDEDLDLKEKEIIWLVLTMTARVRVPMSITTMAQLLELDEQSIIHALRHLRSLLHIPHGANHISMFHTSLAEFILSPERSGDLFCNVVEHDRRLVLGCFSTMQRLLRFNICALDSSFIFDRAISDLTKKINEAISPELFYACRYWAYHLGFVKTLDGVSSALEDFLSNRLLFWMEVMNLRNCIGTGAEMLAEAHHWLQKSGGTNDTVELALDAQKFVSVFGKSPVSGSTPHIYVSALPFWPQTCPVRLRYWRRTQGLIRLEGSAIERRDLLRIETYTTSSEFQCVAFSPDGIRIVSGSSDRAIRVWDARSGDLVVGPFKGHISRINSVAFSPDSTRIVSGGEDRTIQVWDARSGDLIAGPFKGHTEWVTSVGFSPNGILIVSGSDDRTIRVWDARSGDLIAGPFKGHTSWIHSVAFSPGGTRIVSGSDDRTIRVWDARSGNVVARPFEGHTGVVRSVAFSPNGTRIVSGSEDKTIRVWDARSGDLVVGPFEGHTSWINSVAFSPDGIRIASGSSDQTIRIWDARSGDLVAGPFEGHTDGVTFVGFSPDGTRIVSGSWDKTIRVWDPSSPAVHASQLLGGWLMDEDGMLTTQQGQLLLYVPADLRVGLLRPQNTVCIHEAGFLALHFDGVLLGCDWVKCYRS